MEKLDERGGMDYFQFRAAVEATRPHLAGKASRELRVGGVLCEAFFVLLGHGHPHVAQPVDVFRRDTGEFVASGFLN